MSASSTLPSSMNAQEWYNFMSDHKDEIKEISDEMPSSFLMYGQSWQGKILYKNKKYIVTAWWATKYVDIEECTDEANNVRRKT